MFATNATSFSNEIINLYSALKTITTNSPPHTPPRDTPTSLNYFTPITEEVSKIFNSSDPFCDLDPFLTSHPKQCAPTLLFTLNNIINHSIATGVYVINSSPV